MDWPTDAGFTLAPGMRVCSRGFEVSGEIVSAGQHPGEWLVQKLDGEIVVCLAEEPAPLVWDHRRTRIQQ